MLALSPAPGHGMSVSKWVLTPHWEGCSKSDHLTAESRPSTTITQYVVNAYRYVPFRLKWIVVKTLQAICEPRELKFDRTAWLGLNVG